MGWIRAQSQETLKKPEEVPRLRLPVPYIRSVFQVLVDNTWLATARHVRASSQVSHWLPGIIPSLPLVARHPNQSERSPNSIIAKLDRLRTISGGLSSSWGRAVERDLSPVSSIVLTAYRSLSPWKHCPYEAQRLSQNSAGGWSQGTVYHPAWREGRGKREWSVLTQEVQELFMHQHTHPSSRNEPSSNWNGFDLMTGALETSCGASGTLHPSSENSRRSQSLLEVFVKKRALAWSYSRVTPQHTVAIWSAPKFASPQRKKWHHVAGYLDTLISVSHHTFTLPKTVLPVFTQRCKIYYPQLMFILPLESHALPTELIGYRKKILVTLKLHTCHVHIFFNFLTNYILQRHGAPHVACQAP